MKVSIITVSFNSAATIEDTLVSVASQTWRDIEHIVIDGGSTDGTQALLNRHSAGLSKLISEPDNGIYDAMNKGVAMATGDVVVFLNADDVYKDSGVIKRVVHYMQDAGLDALYGNVEFFHPSRPEHVVRTYNSGHFAPARLGWGWMPAHPALFVRRRIFEQYGAFDKSFKIAGDFDFIARVFKLETLQYRYIPEVLVRMQIGGVSTSGLRATYLLNREILRACQQNGIRSNWLMLLTKYFHKVREFF